MKDPSNKKNINRSIERVNSLFEIPSVQYIFTARNTPHRAIVVSNRSGNYQLYAVDFHSGFCRQVTDEEHGEIFGSISSNGEHIYLLCDTSGNEHGHFTRVPFEGGESIDVTPDIGEYFSYSVSTSDNGEVFCFTAAMDGENSVFLSEKDKNGKYVSRKLYSTPHSLSEPVCAPDGSAVCVAETDKGGDRLVFLPTGRDETTTHSRFFNAAFPLEFSRTEQKILTLARRGQWYRPVFYDSGNNDSAEINHPSFCGDVWVLSWNQQSCELVLCDVHQAQQKLYRYNTHTKDLKRIGPKTGSFNFHYGSASFFSDESLIVRWSDFNSPGQLITVSSQYGSWGKVPEWVSTFSSDHKIESVWIDSSDEERVQMWVVRPQDTEEPLPFIIGIHGGPHGVSLDEFSPEAHTWLENGFGYCAVNYRGSIGFGEDFERKIYGSPGYWEVEDIVSARNWLVQNKYADPNLVTLYGWSWGGFVTLLALGKYPTLWNSAVAGTAIADFLAQYEDESAYFKAIDKERFGGTPENAREQYITSSPITYAQQIQAPVFIMHGENDVRCSPRQMKNFITVLRENNKDFVIEWFKPGHTGGFTDISLRKKLMNKAVRFVLSIKNKPLRKLAS